MPGRDSFPNEVTRTSSLCDVSVNRRLDEWVPMERVDLQQKDVSVHVPIVEEKVDIDGPERKLTRNQKRKHDEINHVQKVFIESISRTTGALFD